MSIVIRRATIADVATIAQHRSSMFLDMGSATENAVGDLIATTEALLHEAIPRGKYVGWMACIMDEPSRIVAGAGNRDGKSRAACRARWPVAVRTAGIRGDQRNALHGRAAMTTGPQARVRRWRSRLALGILAQLLLGGCMHAGSIRPVRAASSQPVDERAIRDARAAQNRAIAEGDADRAATFWTEDVTIRRALGQDVRGRVAYRQLIAPAGNRDSTLVYQREPTSVEVSDHFPLAFETGAWVGHLGGVGGPAVIGGRYSAQWVKRDGSWLIRSEVFAALSCSGAGCRYVAVP
jgi:ketosteroid isomerase-like protein